MVREYFLAKMRELKLLLNSTGNWEPFAIACWERIKESTYKTDDVENAMKHILEGDAHVKMNFPVLIKALSEARALRLEREARDLRAEDNFWFEGEKYEPETCKVHHCRTCGKFPNGRCDTLGQATVLAIKLKSSGQLKGDICEALHREFPEAGFNDQPPISGKRWARKVDGKMASCDAQGNIYAAPKLRVANSRLPGEDE